MLNNIETLKAQILAAQEKAAQTKINLLEELKLKSQLKVLTDENTQVKNAVLEHRQAGIDTIKARIQLAKEAVLTADLYSLAKKRIEFRDLGLRNFGKEFELVTGLIGGLIYIRADAKELAMEQLGISDSLLSELLTAYVSKPNYNVSEGIIEPGHKGDMNEFLALMPMLAQALGVDELKFSPVPTQELFDTMYANGYKTALTNKQLHDLQLAEWEQQEEGDDDLEINL